MASQSGHSEVKSKAYIELFDVLMREVVAPSDEEFPLLLVILHVVVGVPTSAAVVAPPTEGVPVGASCVHHDVLKV